MPQNVMERKMSQDMEVSFKTPPPSRKGDIPSGFESLTSPQQHFKYFGATYDQMLDLIREKGAKIDNLEKEIVDFDEKAASFVFKLCIFFSILLALVACWAFFLRK
ncbi:MAG: hypothetical protein A3K16_04695 [Omnitrophica bacterium RIFCSPLOWO2_01_FULL_45_24]|nr:MAG: hypothetical protein A3K16_04695 [Omnitrophica bacterium RIFCSPLOWO2_01_FULL_45_24]